MKKIFFLIFIISVGVVPQQVFAHTLKIDGNIGVNLHIDPDDAPIAGRESKFLVDIQDKSGRFNVNNPENCDCTLTIMQKDTVLNVLPVTTGGMYNQIRYTFPSSGTYHVIVEGKPNGKGVAFQSFRTNFEYFISSGDSQGVSLKTDSNPLLVWLPYIAALIGSCIVLMFVLS
jgi:hypothetical protein